MNKIFYCLFLLFAVSITTVYANDTYTFNPEFPDGLENTVVNPTMQTHIYPIIKNNLLTTNYVVPAGYNLVITSIVLSNEEKGLKIKPSGETTSIMVINESDKFNRLILGAGDTLSASSDYSIINGYLSIANVIPITKNNLFSNNYTVPDNKTLFISQTGLYGDDKYISIRPAITAPTITPIISDSVTVASKNIDTGIYFYKVTFYSELTGLESLAATSDTYTLTDTTAVALITFLDTTTTNMSVTGRKIYRTYKNSDITAPYYLLATIADNSTEFYIDNKNDTELTTVYSSALYDDIKISQKDIKKAFSSGKVSAGEYIIVNENNVISSNNNSASINGFIVTNE